MCFKLLRLYRDEGKTFDVIVLDPPKFADNKAQLNGACRGYKDINMIALQLLNPGGVLLTFSCSGLPPADLIPKNRGRCGAGCKTRNPVYRTLKPSERSPNR